MRPLPKKQLSPAKIDRIDWRLRRIGWHLEQAGSLMRLLRSDLRAAVSNEADRLFMNLETELNQANNWLSQLRKLRRTRIG